MSLWELREHVESSLPAVVVLVPLVTSAVAVIVWRWQTQQSEVAKLVRKGRQLRKDIGT